MGNKLSVDFYIDYAIYNAYLDELENKNVNAVYKNVMTNEFMGLHQMEAVIKLIWIKGVYEKAHISMKYAQLVKKLEDEVEGGTNHFKDVFFDFVKKTITSGLKDLLKMKEDKAETITMNTATFLGHLVNVDVFNINVLTGLIQQAENMKGTDEAIKCLNKIVKKNFMKSFDGIFDTNENTDTK